MLIPLLIATFGILAADSLPANSKQAEKIHRNSIVIDCHNDLPAALRSKGASDFDKFDRSWPQPEFNTDISRLRKGGMGAQFWVAFTGLSRRKYARDRQSVSYELNPLDQDTVLSSS